jgi:hypothetical protein
MKRTLLLLVLAATAMLLACGAAWAAATAAFALARNYPAGGPVPSLRAIWTQTATRT